MVALTQKFFPAHYAWFTRGGSHIADRLCKLYVRYEYDYKGHIHVTLPTLYYTGVGYSVARNAWPSHSWNSANVS